MSISEYQINVKHLGKQVNQPPVYLAEIPAFGSLAQVHDSTRETALDVAVKAISVLIEAYQDQGLELPSASTE